MKLTIVIGPDNPVQIENLRPGVMIVRHAKTGQNSATAPMPCHPDEVTSLRFSSKIGQVKVQQVTCRRCFLAYETIFTRDDHSEIAFRIIGTVLISRQRRLGRLTN